MDPPLTKKTCIQVTKSIDVHTAICSVCFLHHTCRIPHQTRADQFLVLQVQFPQQMSLMKPNHTTWPFVVAVNLPQASTPVQKLKETRERVCQLSFSMVWEGLLHGIHSERSALHCNCRILFQFFMIQGFLAEHSKNYHWYQLARKHFVSAALSPEWTGAWEKRTACIQAASWPDSSFQTVSSQQECKLTHTTLSHIHVQTHTHTGNNSHRDLPPKIKKTSGKGSFSKISWFPHQGRQCQMRASPSFPGEVGTHLATRSLLDTKSCCLDQFLPPLYSLQKASMLCLMWLWPAWIQWFGKITNKSAAKLDTYVQSLVHSYLLSSYQDVTRWKWVYPI